MNRTRQIVIGTVATLFLAGTAAATTLIVASDEEPQPQPTQTQGSSPSYTPTAQASPDESSPPAGEVLVFYVKVDGDPYDRSSYVPLKVPVEPDLSASDRLEVALLTQLKGDTSQAEQEDLGSIFTQATQNMLNAAIIQGDEATVNFADFSSTLSGASTSEGRIPFFTALNATVFQFPEVQRITYQFDGDCDRFWAWQEAGVCQLITREAWDSIGQVGQGVDI